ncbi:cation-translocating P-type ATPase [Aquabacter spiritensis]|uniref:Ca2+-transporting ATPase n=1 Tax=Aquabacter spiritensis TaxID=933073 RepID=A0A4R3M435_9HYPH|nr:cation-transporting P-type ATPase [Aquabacter spiritensis]TCT07802.1 Ca2+-transporting ATPase [Aquabacter spiritensis]
MPPAPRCRVRHHLPGRTRLDLSGPWPPDGLGGVRERLAAAGIVLVRADPQVRSLLLTHPPREAATILSCVRRALAGEELDDPAPPPPAGPSPAAARPRRILAHAAPLPDAPDTDLDEMSLLAPDAVAGRLGVSASGLDAAQVTAARARAGANHLPQPVGRSGRAILLAQVSNLPVALLAGSCVLSLATGGVLDALVTLAVIGINTGIGFGTENATERLIRRLSRPVAHPASVVRAGIAASVPADDVVPGDILVLAPGMRVAADARLIEARDLTLDESTLTGESLPVEKTAAALALVPRAVAERHNLVHAGTIVTGGDGRAIVLRTGARTEAARTQLLIGRVRAPRPMIEEKLEALSGRLALGCLGASGLLLAGSLLRGEPLVAALRSAIALAVAAIPEGLPAVATTTLAIGAREMEKEKAFVRALPAIEAIGSIDTICLDKTGTLTRNEMAVVRAAGVGGAVDLEPGTPVPEAVRRDLAAFAEAVALCSEAELEPRAGSPTELALLDLAAASGLDIAVRRAALPVRALSSRNHARRFMATEHVGPSGPLVFVKGAPEDVLALCATEGGPEEARPLTDARRAEWLALNTDFAGRGLRVLAAARGAGPLGDGAPTGLAFLGLAGLADPVRAEAAEAIDLFHKAGIRTIMMTGDQAGTALAVAEALALSRTGILRMATGPDIAGLDPAALGDLALATSVFARVSPADKLRIVEALQAKGRRVAMLGDGVNDGPALRAAAVGVAVGRRATPVAREVADLVLADDDLRELARAIARGRATEDNVRNAIRFLFATNLSEIFVMLAETLHGAGEGETPMELFWLNLVTDILPALGLALAEPRGDVMDRAPRRSDAPLFDRAELQGLALDGGAIAAGALAGHFLALGRFGAGPRTRAVTFTTLAFGQILHAWALRDRSSGSPRTLRISERRLEASLGGALALLAVPFLVPGLRRLLGIAPAQLSDLGLAALLGGASFVVGEGRRIVRGAS